MNITLTITGDSAAEVKEAVKQLSASYSIGGNGQLQEIPTGGKTVKQSTKTEEPASAQPAIQQAVAETKTETGLKITLEEIRKVMGEKNKENKREQMKACLAKYEAGSLTDLDPKHYIDLYNDIIAA